MAPKRAVSPVNRGAQRRLMVGQPVASMDEVTWDWRNGRLGGGFFYGPPVLTGGVESGYVMDYILDPETGNIQTYDPWQIAYEVQYTEDDGGTWETIVSSEDLTAFYYASAPDYNYLYTGILASTASALYLTGIAYAPAPVYQRSALVKWDKSSHAFTDLIPGITYKFNCSDTFALAVTPDDSVALAANSQNAGTAYLGVLVKGGVASRVPRGTQPSGTLAAYNIAYNAMATDDGQDLFLVWQTSNGYTNRYFLLSSANGGTSWSNQELSWTGNGNWGFIDLPAEAKTTMWNWDGSDLLWSWDKGATWNTQEYEPYPGYYMWWSEKAEHGTVHNLYLPADSTDRKHCYVEAATIGNEWQDPVDFTAPTEDPILGTLSTPILLSATEVDGEWETLWAVKHEGEASRWNMMATAHRLGAPVSTVTIVRTTQSPKKKGNTVIRRR